MTVASVVSKLQQSAHFTPVISLLHLAQGAVAEDIDFSHEKLD